MLHNAYTFQDTKSYLNIVILPYLHIDFAALSAVEKDKVDLVTQDECVSFFC